MFLLITLSCAWGVSGPVLDKTHLVPGAGFMGVASLILLLMSCLTNRANHLQYIATATGASSLIASLTIHVIGEVPWSEGEPLLVYLPISVLVYQCLPISLMVKSILAISFLLLHILVTVIFYIRDNLELNIIEIILIGVGVIVNISCLWETCCCEIYSKATFVTLGKILHCRQQINIEKELLEILQSCAQGKRTHVPSVITAVKFISLPGMLPEYIVQDVCTKLTQTLTKQKVRITDNYLLLLGSCDDVNEHIVNAWNYLKCTCLSDIKCAIAVHVEEISYADCLLPAQLLNAETVTMKLVKCTDKVVISNSVLELLSTENFNINGPTDDEPTVYYEITSIKNDWSMVSTTLSTTNEAKLLTVLEKRFHHMAPEFIPKLETVFDSKNTTFIIMYPEIPLHNSPRVSPINNPNELLTNISWDMRSAFYVPRYYPMFNWFILHFLTAANSIRKDIGNPGILRNTEALHMMMASSLAFVVTFLRCVELWPSWYLVMMMVALLSIALLTTVAYLVFTYRYTHLASVVNWIVFIILNTIAIMLMVIPSQNNEILSNCVGDITCIVVMLLIQFLPIRYWLVKSAIISAVSVGYITYSRSHNDSHNCDLGLVSILWSTVLLITCQRDLHMSINLLLAAHHLYHTQYEVLFEARAEYNQILLTLLPSHILPMVGQHCCYTRSHATAGLLIIEHTNCNDFKRETTQLMEKYRNVSLCISEMNYTVIMSDDHSSKSLHPQHLTQLLDLSINIINTVDGPIKMAIHYGEVVEVLLGGIHYQLCGNVVNECQNILLIAKTSQILLTSDAYKLTGQEPTIKLLGTKQILGTEMVLYSIKRQVYISLSDVAKQLTEHTITS